MTQIRNGSKNDVILRSARRARLEGRTALLQPDLDTAVEPGSMAAWPAVYNDHTAIAACFRQNIGTPE
jgi:hypothetical protein